LIDEGNPIGWKKWQEEYTGDKSLPGKKFESLYPYLQKRKNHRAGKSPQRQVNPKQFPFQSPSEKNSSLGLSICLSLHKSGKKRGMVIAKKHPYLRVIYLEVRQAG
jgi:hypothetical protein